MSTNLVTKHESFATHSAPRVLRGAEALLTVHEVAELLNVPVSWVYERTRRRGAEYYTTRDRKKRLASQRGKGDFPYGSSPISERLFVQER